MGIGRKSSGGRQIALGGRITVLTGARAWRTMSVSDNFFKTEESLMARKYHLISAFT